MESKVNSKCSRGLISVIISEPGVAAPCQCEPWEGRVCPQEGAVEGHSPQCVLSSCPQSRWGGRAGQVGQ